MSVKGGTSCYELKRQSGVEEVEVDISTGLTSVGLALGIVKDLREIEKGFDAAALKSQMADLYGALADVKIALSDARVTIHEKDRKVKELEDKIATLTSGEACPLCGTGRMKVVASKAHPELGVFGVQERTLKCTDCNHSEKHLYDPTGVTKKSK